MPATSKSTQKALDTYARQSARAAHAQATFNKARQAEQNQRLHQAQGIRYEGQAPANQDGTLAAFGLLFGMIIAGAVLLRLIGTALRPKTTPHQANGWTPPPAAPAPVAATGQYRTAPSLLTPTEQRFHDQLRAVVGDRATIQCKVRLADLLLSERHDLTAFRRVSQKHIDFVLCDRRTLRPLVAVELDDRSHNQPGRIARDQFVNAAYARAGMPLLHVPVSSQYAPAALEALVQGYLPAKGAMPGE